MLKLLSSSKTRQLHKLNYLRSFSTTAVSNNDSSCNSDKNGMFVDVEHVKQWSAKHEDYARKILEVPGFLHQHTCNEFKFDFPCHTDSESYLIEYLRWRKWDFVSNNKREGDYKEEADNKKMALALLSHSLTFPLTLGNNIDLFLRSTNSNSTFLGDNDRTKPPKAVQKEVKHKNSAKKKIRLCCIGPRAEANLPLDKWKEFLIMANLQHNTCTNSEYEWIIDFIGPEVPIKMESRHISLFDSGEIGSEEELTTRRTLVFTHHSLTMNYYCGFFHQHVIKMYQSIKQKIKDDTSRNDIDQSELTSKILHHWDGFILFNPGIGHDNLKNGWTPTLNFIIKSKKPIITTAHSKLDSQRDLQVWRSVIDEEGGYDRSWILDNSFEYVQNPFASRMTYKDPFPPSSLSTDEIHLVNPNYSILRIGRCT